jgi:endoglucanase
MLQMTTATNVYATLLVCLTAPVAVAQAACDGGGEAIHANQHGFLPGRPPTVILASGSPVPRPWQLTDHRGDVLASGNSRVFGPDALSGRHVHRISIDIAGIDGAGFRVSSGCAASRPFAINRGVYAELPFDALNYFYQNRSGIEIDAALTGSALLARPAGHARDVAGCRRGEDGDGNKWPGCDYTLDVTGGWYDAGDHGKYVVNGGIAAWTLLGLYEYQRARGLRDLFADGSAALPEAGNGISDLLDEARFELEFLLRMQAPDGAQAAVPVGVRRSHPDLAFTRIDASGMAHHKVADLAWAAFPLPPHENRQERVLHPVSTAATLNLAATAAQCARIWQPIDDDFAARCLAAAEQAWAAARRNPEVYFIATFGGSGMYGDDELGDEFFWAAAELFITTGSEEYRVAVEESPFFRAAPRAAAGWPEVAPLGLVSLAVVPNDLKATAIEAVRGRLVEAAERFVEEQDATGYYIPFGSENYAWGSNAVLLNRAILLALAHDFTGRPQFLDAVVNVMDYLLGRNPLDVSYVSGYGEQSMRNPHHRYWAPSYDSGLPGPPAGALSGGPNNTAMVDPVARAMRGRCAPQACWRDDPEAYSLNEVAINWNAPLVWVAAWLAARGEAGTRPQAGADREPGPGTGAGQPPDMAPTIRNGSRPSATAAGSNASGESSEISFPSP